MARKRLGEQLPESSLNHQIWIKMEAQQIAICSILDGIARRFNGQKKHDQIVDIVRNEYSRHHVDGVTCLAVKGVRLPYNRK